MSAARPTRREIRNWLALAKGGPFTLRCERSVTGVKLWVVTHPRFPQFNRIEPIDRLVVTSHIARWQKKFPQ